MIKEASGKAALEIGTSKIQKCKRAQFRSRFISFNSRKSLKKTMIYRNHYPKPQKRRNIHNKFTIFIKSNQTKNNHHPINSKNHGKKKL